MKASQIFWLKTLVCHNVCTFKHLFTYFKFLKAFDSNYTHIHSIVLNEIKCLLIKQWSQKVI